jgi:hypothetical protein
MNSIFLTRHAEQRTSQRGFLRSGIETIFHHGEMISDQEVLMTDREINARIMELKNEIQSLDKLRNRKLVVDGSTIITSYCLTKKAKRKCRIRMREAA